MPSRGTKAEAYITEIVLVGTQLWQMPFRYDLKYDLNL